MRSLLALLALLLGTVAHAAPDALDALQWRADENPSAGLRALQALPATPENAQRLNYLGALMRIRSGERLDDIDTQLPAGSPASWLLRAQQARMDGNGAELLAMSTRALEAQPQACRDPASAPAACELRQLHEAWLLLARAESDQGELQRAMVAVQAAQVAAQRLDDPRREAQTLVEKALLHLQRDEPELARQHIAQAQEKAIGQPMAQARVLLVEALLARTSGQYPQQRRLLEQALALARQHDAPAIALVLQVNLADHFLLAGEAARALEIGTQALDNLAQRPEAGLESSLRHNLSVALVRLGEFDAAREQLAQQELLQQRQRLPARQRAEQFRELGQAWTGAAQWRDALRAYHAERELTEASNEREREATLTALRRDGAQAQREAEMALLREEKALSDRAVQNQQRLRWIVVLAAMLLGVGLAIGLLFWLGSSAANRRLHRSRLQLQTLAERDALTGLGNRRAFQLMMQSRGYGEGTPMQGALLLIDIDHFKRINDTHGHAAGDAVLQAVAQRLAAQVRQDDLLVRWGGEEFLLYCPRIPDSALRALAQRLLRSLQATPVAIEGELALRVTTSIGFANFPLAPADTAFAWERALHWVDLALYHAKQTGRARAVGITAASLADETSIALVEDDFAGAANAARVTLSTVLADDS